MGAEDLELQRLRKKLGIDMAAERAGVEGVVGEIETIEELAIESPRLDVQVVRPKPRVPRRLHREVWHLIEAHIVGVVEEAAAGTGQVDQKVRVQPSLTSDPRPPA